jgi:environmental stress-induced protein Ves
VSGLRVVRTEEHRRVRWRNGLGWTTELCAERDTPDWIWRLSLAESEGPARFSTFPGIDRELLLTQGAGLRLSFGDRAPVTLRSGQSHRFLGEQAVEGIPLNGPTRQLNVMWRRDQVAARLTVHLHASELVVPFGESQTVTAIHVIRGAAHVQVGADGADLRRAETAVVTASLDTPLDACSAQLTEPGCLATVRFDPVVG